MRPWLTRSNLFETLIYFLRRYQTVNQSQRQPANQQQRREIQIQNQQPHSNQNNGQNVTLKDALDKLYADIESAPSYSAKITAYLRNNIVHSRHRRIVKKKFPRRRIISRFPFDIFSFNFFIHFRF